MTTSRLKSEANIIDHRIFFPPAGMKTAMEVMRLRNNKMKVREKILLSLTFVVQTRRFEAFH